MKSRVKKNADIHQKIASDTESTVENSDLSHFANRLSEIDDQFERVHTSKQADMSPSRARKLDQEETDGINPMVDTFETHYLDDFLEEVKEYNVKKGYRDISNTQENVLDGLREKISGSKYHESKLIEEPKLNDLDETQTIFSEKELAKIAEELFVDYDEDVIQDDEDQHDIEDTFNDDEILVFGEEVSFDTYQDESDNQDEDELETKDQDEESTDEVTISMAIQEMSYDNDEDNDDELDDEDSGEAFSLNQGEHDLFDQTQTLQHKIVDLENNLDQMSASTNKTNRLLHVVLSLLLFAIIVVALMIAAQVL